MTDHPPLTVGGQGLRDGFLEGEGPTGGQPSRVPAFAERRPYHRLIVIE